MASVFQGPGASQFFQQAINQAAQKGGVPPSQLQQAVQQQMFQQPQQAQQQAPQTNLLDFLRMFGGPGASQYIQQGINQAAQKRGQ